MSNQDQASTNDGKILEHPIPPPAHDTQYRAIGLVWGVYQPQDKLTCGEMLIEEKITLETVLLGRVISVVKKHINLAEPHLWVVYPRTRQKEDYLHLQIVGIWEPTTLNEASQRAEQLKADAVSEVKAQAGYFSIRGELVFYAEAEQKIIMKIKQFSQDKPSFFKLRLSGVLPDEGDKLGWFWELDAQLKGEELVVTRSEKIAPVNNRKRKPNTFSERTKTESRTDRAPKKIIAPASDKKPKPVQRRTKKTRSGRNPNSESN